MKPGSLTIINHGIMAETANAEYYARQICDLMDRKHDAYMKVQELQRQRRWILVRQLFMKWK